MNLSKPMLGLLVGAALGAMDGGSAWFYPSARTMMARIIIGSTIKGLVAGVAAGVFARKVNSVPLGILFGLAVGLVLALLVALMEGGHYIEIILPGSIVGLVAGYATQQFGRRPDTAAAQ